MLRKLTVAVFLMLSFMVILWSAEAVAEEKAATDKEAHIQKVKEKMRDIEIAIERESDAEKKAALKNSLQEHRKMLNGLMGKPPAPQKPKGEQKEIELAKLLKGKAAAKPKTNLMILRVEHANAQTLEKIIKKFLTPAGIIASDPDSNSLIIKDTPAGLEDASQIIKALDVQRRRGIPREQPQRRDQPQVRREESRERAEREQPRSEEPRERAERENIFFGKVLAANKESLTIETRDGKENVILYVPTRVKEDGTQTLMEDLSMMVSKLEIGSSVRVQWRQGNVRRLIVRVTKIEGETPR